MVVANKRKKKWSVKKGTYTLQSQKNPFLELINPTTHKCLKLGHSMEFRNCIILCQVCKTASTVVHKSQ